MIDAELYQRIDCEIMMLEQTRKAYVLRLEHLQGYKGAFLRWATHGKEKYYYIKHTGSLTYKYVGRSNQQDVKRIKEVKERDYESRTRLASITKINPYDW